ncbi:hypothetical protein LTR53_007366 [Teratosphaeriaceae sp. CCFEE 6253]|nr:hypothetical protein LTR53_007366 [Teratosphaeriaceae sp. CCFEE 6253]
MSSPGTSHPQPAEQARINSYASQPRSGPSAPNADAVAVADEAWQSCVACRRLKRKCSKEVPTCSLCGRVGRECEYPSPASSPGGKPTTGRKRSWTQANGMPTSPPPSNPGGQAYGFSQPASRAAPTFRPLSGTVASDPDASGLRRSRFPAAWYLDSVAARGLEITLPVDLTWEEVNGASLAVSIEDAVGIVDHHSRTTHCWFPVVSLMRLKRFLAAVTTPLTRADTVALFVSMALVSQGHDRSPASDAHAPTYRSVKAALAACEQRGQLSTDYIAATVLTGVYEMAHGMYPAAYFTVGSSARACCAVGLHDKRFATQLPARVDTWTEVEERRRLWWATLILDRYINIGFLLRPPCTPPIPANEVVPANDTSWDEGELAVNPLLVMSIENRARVSPFARTCQAAHLLGRVSQHVSEHPDPADASIHFQEAHQIQRAASALLSILQQEYHDTPVPDRHRLFSAMALCCSALLALYDIHSCIDTGSMESGGRNMGVRVELQELAIEGFKRVSLTILDLAEEIREASRTTTSLDCISPLVFNALYQAAGTYAWYARENGSASHVESLEKLRAVMALLESRWRVAGDYLALLKGTETEYVGGCTM